MKSNQRVLLAGGGTGGHVIPLLAVAKELKNKVELFFLGSNSGPEAALAQSAGIPFSPISCGKFRRYFSLKNLVDVFKLIAGVFEAYRKIADFKPRLVFAKGGYVSLPTVIAAWLKKVPIIIHESDVSMGLANRIAGRMAVKILTGFPVTLYPEWVQKKAEEVGIPVSWEKQHHRRPNAIFVTGGSQGSAGLNAVIIEALPELLLKFEVYHQAGSNNLADVQASTSSLPERLKKNYHLFGSLSPEEWSLCRDKASLAVSRAGASSIYSFALAGVPMILFPLPSAANNHQYENAKFMQDIGAAVWFDERSISPSVLAEFITFLIKDKKRLETMSVAGRSWAKKDSAARVAEIILEKL